VSNRRAVHGHRDRPTSPETAGRRGGADPLPPADQAVIAAQGLAGNAAVAAALGRRRRSPAASDPEGGPPPALTLVPPRLDLHLPVGGFDHLLGGRRLQRPQEIVDRFDRQSGEVPLGWNTEAGGPASDRNTRWRVHQRTLVATSTLPGFAAVAAHAGDGSPPVTSADRLLGGLGPGTHRSPGLLAVRYGDAVVAGGAAQVTSRVADDATLVVDLALHGGQVRLTGRRDAQAGVLDWEAELTLDLDALSRVLWRDVFDRLQTRRRGGVRKLRSAAAAPPRPRPDQDRRDDEPPPEPTDPAEQEKNEDERTTRH